MTTEAQQAAYLAGESEGSEIGQDERAVLDRVRRQLASEAMWSGAPDVRSQLLKAAAAEPGPAPASLEQPDEPVSLDHERRRRESPRPMNKSVADGSAPQRIGRHAGHRSGSRSRVGAAVLAVAAAAAIGFVTADRLAGPDGPATVATFELAATPLDPDVTAAIDIKPTAAGVEIELRLMGLDNATGPDYYSAWLLSDDEAIPLGSFHWRKGGVPIILWSGVDDPAYDQFVVTRQRQGDGGVRSDEIVVTGDVPSLADPDAG